MERSVAGLIAALLLCAACGPKGFPWPLRGGAGARPAEHAEVSPLGPTYSRVRARALIRRIARPTRANLDYAAYAANVVLHEVDAEVLQPAVPPRIDREQLFGGAIEAASIVSDIARAPLTPSERRQPLAFSPLVDYLAEWNAGAAAPLEAVRAAVRSERWGVQGRVGVHFQEIVAAYLHRPARGAPELWAKVEFAPWARLFPEMPDDDADGYPAIYGRVRRGALTAAVLRRIEQDYAGRTLARGEVRAWADKLASYWYPSRNTDVVELRGAGKWPTADTEPEVVASLRGFEVRDATIVIRGKPHGVALYNVFAVAGMPALGPAAASRPAAAADAAGTLAAQLKQAAVSVELDPLRRSLREELSQNGGSYAAWAARVAPWHARIRRALARRPQRLQALIGRDGYLFFRKSLAYVVAGDLKAQAGAKNPFPAIVAFKDYLAARKIDFLLVPVPAKAEVFVDKLPGSPGAPPGGGSINPGARRFFGQLVAAGVEVVDLLPALLAARETKRAGDEPVYQPQDTHWTDRGLSIAAAVIAERIKRYPWYPALQRAARRFTTKRVTFKRQGDLCSRLAPAEQRRFRPATLVARQVLTADGALYEDDPASPIALLGDSFTGVYQRTDSEHAGVSAQLAREIGHAVDLMMSWGGGPSVRRALLARGDAEVRKKRLVIWLFAARDLHDYWEDWQVIAQPAREERR